MSTARTGVVPYQPAIVLPGAGAFLSGPIALCDPFLKQAFLVRYTSAAIGGRARFRLLWLNDESDEFLDTRSDVPGQIIIDEVDTIAFAATAAPQLIFYVLRVRNPAGLQRLRLQAAEIGMIATPGTVQIQFSQGQF